MRVTARPGFDAGRPLVTVTVANVGDRSIYTEDLKTACSIVYVERSVGYRWEPIGACGAERAAFVVEIASGRARTVKIDLRNAGARPGRYRAVFSYRFSTGPEGEETERAESAPFNLDW